MGNQGGREKGNGVSKNTGFSKGLEEKKVSKKNGSGSGTTGGSGGIGRSKEKGAVFSNSSGVVYHEHVKEGNLGPDSFKPFVPLDNVPADVNVLEASGHFHKYQDFPPHEYSTRIHLCRAQPFYFIQILPSMKRNLPSGRLYLKELSALQEVTARNNCLSARFTNADSVVVEFKSNLRFQFFFKMLQTILQINSDEGIVSYKPNKKICLYKVNKKSGKKKSKGSKISGGFGQGSKGQQFYDRPVGEWLAGDFQDWTKFLYIQKEGEMQIITVFQYISEPEVMSKFIDYFQVYEGNFTTLYRDITRHGSEKEEIPKDGKREQCLEALYGDNCLCDALIKEMKAIQDHPSKLFDMTYHLVLKKRIDVSVELVNNGEIHLRDLEHDLRTKKRYLWKLEDCKFYILSLLLYQKSEELWIKDLTKEFIEYEEKTLKEKVLMSNKDPEDMEWYDIKRHLLIDDEEWGVMLREFNDQKDIELEAVSFDVFIMKEQNKLRKEMKELKAKEDEKNSQMENESGEIEGEIKKMKDEIETLRAQIPMIQNKIKKFSDKLEAVKKEKGEDSLPCKRIQKMIDRTQGKITTINEEILEKEKELEPILEKQKKSGGGGGGGGGGEKSEDMKRLEKRILSCVPATYTKEQRSEMFEDKEARRKYIQDHLTKKLQEYSVKMTEFGVKLVISIKKGHAAGGLRRNLMRFVDKFYTPSFYKWGIIHSKVLLSSVGMDWFSDSLVMVTDLQIGTGYEEVIAIDCFCPIIANIKTMENQLLQLSETIVKANINYKYSLCNIFGEDMSYNCQEFSENVIRSLNYTPFFPVVEKYLKDLKDTLVKMDVQEGTNLKFLTVKSDFKKAFYNKKKKKNKKKKNQHHHHHHHHHAHGADQKLFIDDPRFQPDKKDRIYFLTHSDLDDFYWLLYDMDMDFESHFPGHHQLLKGFDRAFWMRFHRLDDDAEPEVVELLRQTNHSEGCPFNQGSKAADLEESEGLE